jgi:hypothetical protein
MAAGYEHYKTAERIVEAFSAGSYPVEEVIGNMAIAQVHATLAQAAASIDAMLAKENEGVDPAWLDAVKPTTEEN